MASFEDEKRDHEASLEHTETHDTDHSSNEKLEHQQTLSKIDIENKAAYKGDDSDGQIDWTVRNILASIFLCTLYTGMILQSTLAHSSLTIN